MTENRNGYNGIRSITDNKGGIKMIDIRKVNLAYMGREELFNLAKNAYNEFKPLNHLSKGETIVERRTLETISKHLQRFRFEDDNIINLKNDIDDILLSDYERSLKEKNNRNESIKSFREVNKHNLCNSKIYANKYNK